MRGIDILMKLKSAPECLFLTNILVSIRWNTAVL